MGNMVVTVTLSIDYADGLVVPMVQDMMQRHKIWNVQIENTIADGFKKKDFEIVGQIKGSRLLFRKLQQNRMDAFTLECKTFLEKYKITKSKIHQEFLPM